MAELLLELLSEEIPARMQARAAEDLRRIGVERLVAAQLAHDRVQAFVTPRRLALVADGLPAAQPDISEERRGPRVGAPDNAVQGFLKSAGIASLAECEERDTGKGIFYFALIRRAGRPTAEMLPELLRAAVLELPWPKSMRFPAAAFRWVRPLVSAICLFDGRVLPLDLDAVPVGASTAGHRFMRPAPLTVRDFADYAEQLRSAYVVLDPVLRRQRIANDLVRVAKDAGLRLKEDSGLLDEVTGLVEYPVVLTGGIDAAFMALPAEVLTTSMRLHQKYFALLDGAGGLAAKFLFVANNLTDDGGAAIVAGNERVLRARLADAKFFWDQDRKSSLESRVDKLKERIFHAKLGSVYQKVGRVETLAVSIASKLNADAELCERAAGLAKADLSTGMVGEFPELQGVMGRYYALHDGEPSEVAEAIAEHYSPLGPNDRCPIAPVTVVVALADKIDTLVAFFAMNEKPTGSKDPYALRRAALGVIRLTLENRVRYRLSELFSVAYGSIGDDLFEKCGIEYVESLSVKHIDKNIRDAPDFNVLAAWTDYKLTEREAESVSQALLEFFADRLKVHLREQGVRHDLIAAIFALGGEDDLVRLVARVAALDEFLKSEDGANLLTAYRRAANIVRIEEAKDKQRYDAAPDPMLLQLGEEKSLAERLGKVEGLSAAALRQEDFRAAMGDLATLRQPVDEFFAKVTVNCDDPALRANRLRLLSQIRTTLNRVADFSQIEG
jgi:glycyl-tRNA synthetase beta chain